MHEDIHFHVDTDHAKAMQDLFRQLGQRLQLKKPIKAYIAGGMAIHLYTAYRTSLDVDAEFNVRLHIPDDLAVEVPGQDGHTRYVYFDTQYNSTFALMHENYLDDAELIPLNIQNFQIYVLAPVDLAISKIARFTPGDQEDIAELVRQGLTDSDSIEHRAQEALSYFVGNTQTLESNLRAALAITRAIENDGGNPNQPLHHG